MHEASDKSSEHVIQQVTKEQAIYTVIAHIPKGKVANYGQIARLAGYASNARLVGRLLKIMPNDSTIPWHRVVNSQGKLSFEIGSDKYQQQREKLIAEGVLFKKDKINMHQYRWQ
ncbi:MAG: MGMT family protein [Pseudoalteromonas sp.]